MVALPRSPAELPPACCQEGQLLPAPFSQQVKKNDADPLEVLRNTIASLDAGTAISQDALPVRSHAYAPRARPGLDEA